jgi:hypothetical protein
MKYNAGYDMQLRPPRTVYEKIFCPDGVRVEPHEYTVSKSSRYGGHLRHRHDGGLDRETALHWVLHHRHGAALRDRLNLPADEVADLLVRAAAMHPTNKHEVPKMDSTTRMLKNVRSMGEHAYTRLVGDYAKRLYPDLSRERAFTKVFEAPDAEGQAIRHFWQISKQGSNAPLDDDEAADEAEGVEDDALEELKELAAEERRRNPKLTKAQAFAKAYTDPANAKLAQRERAQNRPR